MPLLNCTKPLAHRVSRHQSLAFGCIVIRYELLLRGEQVACILLIHRIDVIEAEAFRICYHRLQSLSNSAWLSRRSSSTSR